MFHLKPLAAGALAAAFFSLCLCAAAASNGVRIFAAQDGNMIVGKVYFTGGGVAEDVDVDVIGQDGLKVATVKTNAKGEFIFSPKSKDAEYKFLVDTGDGRGAKASVSVGTAPAAAKKGDAVPSASSLLAKEKEAELAAARHEASAERAAQDSKALEELVGRAVAKQLVPLQEKLDAYESRIRSQDILGGLGYIFGVVGAVAFLVSRRQRKPEPEPAKPE